MEKKQLKYEDLKALEYAAQGKYLLAVYNTPLTTTVGFFFCVKNPLTVVLHGSKLTKDDKGVVSFSAGSFEVAPFNCSWYDLDGTPLEYVDEVSV